MESAAYAELLCRSNFSFLRGASHPEELLGRADALGYHALALSDLDGVYGIPKAYWKGKSLDAEAAGQGRKACALIHGAELSLEREDPEAGGVRRAGLVLLARDKPGWSLLCRLLTASHADKPKGEAGLSWEVFLGMVQDHAGRNGLLCLPRGEGLGVPLEDFGTPRAPFYPSLQALFKTGLWLPLVRHLDGGRSARTEALRRVAGTYGLRAVAAGDVHYHEAGRSRLQDALTCVREGVPLSEAGWRLFSNAERHLKPPGDMARLFQDCPELIRNGLEAAASCTFNLAELRYRYPAEWIPPGHSSQSYLEALAWGGAARRFPGGLSSLVSSQLGRELELIGRLGFADYFLTIEELVSFARSRRILCQGRGSAANSVTCFCLGITAVDPTRINLLFERFLSEERAEPPDIDVDFEHERRGEVLQHLYERYGRDRAAMVSAVIKYRTRSAVADLSKALGGAQRVGRTLRDADMGAFPEALRGLAEEAADFPRHLSIHSGGFVLSQEPLIDQVPVEPARMEGRTVIQWDKYDLDYVGMMKVDVLALGMLSALRRCMDLTGYGDLADLPPEDPATYAMIQQADTVGVFQIESRAQMNMLGRLKPACFYDLVIEVAIVRPGPIVGQMVHPYLRRRKGEEPVDYEHPKLKAILEKTLGVPLFQEQVMRLAVDLAGFSPGQADELRRAIGAWRSDGRLPQVAERLMEGLRRSGLSEAFCGNLLKEIRGFAEYGFPESHAASFALLTYASCYLKCRHPAAFTCALINSQPLGFYANHSLVDDLKRHGHGVLPLHPLRSRWDCALEDGVLRLGWRVLGGLSEAAALRLIKEGGREPYADLDDFVLRCGLKPGQLSALALGGAFECFGLPPREALWRLLALRALTAAPGEGVQLSLFGGAGHGLRAAGEGPGAFADMDEWESVSRSYQAFGLSPDAHPMEALRRLMPKLPQGRCQEARQARHGQWWRQAGLCIVRQRPGTAKDVVFATLEDESGLLDLVLHPEVYERHRDDFLNNAFFCAEGVLQRDRDSVSMLLKKLRPLDPERMLKVGSHNWH
ncbi:MAG TPA: error-prone DNA polymerase [bacterium]|jgi:error-prone DNA polymerase|nr:error-prone DNA polymerase [bacterium]